MKIVWDDSGKKLYETGVRCGVIYRQNSDGSYGGATDPGVAWNGLTSITERPSGAEATTLYADDIKYMEIRSTEEFGATIEAYTYPDEFKDCDGTAEIAPGVTIGQQDRKTFGLTYRTVLGNDTENNNYGYKLHIIYGATASPSEKAYSTINDSPEAITFSWELTTVPVAVSGSTKPTASLVIDSTKVDATKLAALEDILYGTPTSAPRLPLPSEVASLFSEGTVYAVTNQLYNMETSNPATTVLKSAGYDATLTPISGSRKNVIVTVNDVDVTSTVYTASSGAIHITSANLTGPVAIIATAG